MALYKNEDDYCHLLNGQFEYIGLTRRIEFFHQLKNPGVAALYLSEIIEALLKKPSTREGVPTPGPTKRLGDLLLNLEQILDSDLSYIDAQRVVYGEEQHILNLIELVDTLMAMIGDRVTGKPYTSLRYPRPIDQYQFSTSTKPSSATGSQPQPSIQSHIHTPAHAHAQGGTTVVGNAIRIPSALALGGGGRKTKSSSESESPNEQQLAEEHELMRDLSFLERYIKETNNKLSKNKGRRHPNHNHSHRDRNTNRSSDEDEDDHGDGDGNDGGDALSLDKYNAWVAKFDREQNKKHVPKYYHYGDKIVQEVKKQEKKERKETERKEKERKRIEKDIHAHARAHARQGKENARSAERRNVTFSTDADGSTDFTTDTDTHSAASTMDTDSRTKGRSKSKSKTKSKTKSTSRSRSTARPKSALRPRSRGKQREQSSHSFKARQVLLQHRHMLESQHLGSNTSRGKKKKGILRKGTHFIHSVPKHTSQEGVLMGDQRRGRIKKLKAVLANIKGKDLEKGVGGAKRLLRKSKSMKKVSSREEIARANSRIINNITGTTTGFDARQAQSLRVARERRDDANLYKQMLRLVNTTTAPGPQRRQMQKKLSEDLWSRAAKRQWWLTMATDRAMEEDIQEGKEEARYFYQLNKEEKQRREKEVSEKQESIENYYKSQYEFYKEKALKKIEDDGIRAKAEAKMVRELERDVKEARDQAIADAQSKLRQRDVRYRQQLQEAVMELEVDAHTNIHASNARVHTPDGTGTADAGTDADADIDTAGQGSVLSAKQRAQQRSMMKAKRKQMLMSVSSRPAFYKPSTSFTYPQDVHM